MATGPHQRAFRTALSKLQKVSIFALSTVRMARTRGIRPTYTHVRRTFVRRLGGFLLKLQARLPIQSPKPEDLTVVLKSFEDWSSWIAKNPVITEAKYIRSLARFALSDGIFLKYADRRLNRSEVKLRDTDFRESLEALGINSRLRAELDLMHDAGIRSGSLARVYATESVTPFAATLREMHPNFIGSEYIEDESKRGNLEQVRHEDLLNLSFEDEIFDCVLCNEVLEHIPSIPRALEEIRRVLKPKGLFLATVPFYYDRHEHLVRAVLKNGQVCHLLEPEYHGNPADPVMGSLVFQIPAWNLLDECKNAGFSTAEMVFVASAARGIVGTGIAGVFVLRSVR